ncbi:MAG TPA: LytTR family DNA-binding domain-containing protein [Gammaproteobacteria bacterium]
MRVLIADDEPLARERLRRQLAELPGHEVVGEAANGSQAVRLAGELRPDVVLLDIRMPGMDGLEAAHHLDRLELPPAVVFTTAYGEHALEAFQRHAVAYLLKPIRRERLAEALAHCRRVNRAQLGALAAEEAPRARTHLCARRAGDLVLVPVAEVRLLQADLKYVRVVYPDGELLIEESLKQLQQEFGERFVRVHRATLVSRSALRALEHAADGSLQVVLEGCAERPEVSRRHAAALRALLRGGG